MGLSAASVSIEPFEVSRLRLRRMRHRRICVSNWVLVLGVRVAEALRTVEACSPECPVASFCRSVISRFARVAEAAVMQTHLGYPGSLARAARQEKGSSKSYQVHVFGMACDVINGAERSSRPPRLRPHRTDNASRAHRCWSPAVAVPQRAAPDIARPAGAGSD